MEEVPGDVLHYGRMPREDGLGVDDLALLWIAADVPKADCLERPTKDSEPSL